MIKNIAFYHFFKPSGDLETIKDSLRQRMLNLGIRGSILLSKEEGINSFFAGPEDKVDIFIEFLLHSIQVKNPTFKVSFTDDIPFKRTLVKIKNEIVADPGPHHVDLENKPAPYVSPEELDAWYAQGKDMVIIDTRNDYEFEMGRFKNAVHLGTKNFAEFEDDLKKVPEDWKNKTVVTFCTGGILCEKAAPLMAKLGFKDVYQLNGGILNYFERVGKSHYEGTCFVFDQRVALDAQLNPINTNYKKLGE